jgi:methyl-accepting chemotaxis protein
MLDNWTLGRKLAAGSLLSFALLIIIGVVALRCIAKLADDSEWVTHTHLVLERIGTVGGDLKDAQRGQRGYLLTGDEDFLEPYTRSSTEIFQTVQELRRLTEDNPHQQKRLDSLDDLNKNIMEELRRGVELRKAGDSNDVARLVHAGADRRVFGDITRLLGDMADEENSLLAQRAAEQTSAIENAKRLIVIGTLLCLLSVSAVGILITRSLSRQIGTSVNQIRTSSSDLQAVANQQASSSTEQATAMSEISTTISELLASSRQIAESAQRVAQIATQTAAAARTGTATVGVAEECIATIRSQVDLIVKHMLDLGKKSQQIGGVLDIVSELAEQTNILAVNATIEAAGASEAGRRFAVIAEEIRKLADRVSTATKEVRGLIDDVRSSVNSTVMTTEGGSKAVDAGARQFADVTAAFAEISGMVGTTMEAAREIELSTKQQASAVEQVNVAITGAAQATRETEASSSQTLRTAKELADFSRSLLRIVHQRSALTALTGSAET